MKVSVVITLITYEDLRKKKILDVLTKAKYVFCVRGFSP